MICLKRLKIGNNLLIWQIEREKFTEIVKNENLTVDRRGYLDY